MTKMEHSSLCTAYMSGVFFLMKNQSTLTEKVPFITAKLQSFYTLTM